MSTLSFANYGMFIYIQRPVIDANTLRKNEFSDFPILFAQFDLLSWNLTERSERFAESENEAETRPVFLSFCLFNSKYRDSFAIFHKPSPRNSPSSPESPNKHSWMMICEFQNIGLDIV